MASSPLRNSDRTRPTLAAGTQRGFPEGKATRAEFLNGLLGPPQADEPPKQRVFWISGVRAEGTVRTD